VYVLEKIRQINSVIATAIAIIVLTQSMYFFRNQTLKIAGFQISPDQDIEAIAGDRFNVLITLRTPTHYVEKVNIISIRILASFLENELLRSFLQPRLFYRAIHVVD
jgi:hypothetical protein